MKHATKTETTETETTETTDSGDPAKDFVLDALYSQAVRAAQEFGWPVPARADFEARYRAELAAHGPREE